MKPGVIGLTAHGTMRVPDGPGLGVELEPALFATAAEAHLRAGDQPVYAEDAARGGVIPVKSMA